MPPRRVVTSKSREPRERYAEEVRKLRLDRGLSFRQIGEQLGWDASLFSKIESGETVGGPEVAQAMDHFYGTKDMVLALWELAIADRTQFKARYQRYMLLESEALSLWHFGVSVLHGLLQTREYAREVLASGGHTGEELEKQVKARLTRRELIEGERAPLFRAVVSEAVLRTALKDEAAWREQLKFLVEMSERSNVKLHVLPFSAGPHGLDSTDVMFLRLQDGRTVAYIENAYQGELIETNSAVERLQRAYDALRDLALAPAESRTFILRMLEEASCDPST
ncbi:helix-turn-helix domain-containing protein [Streptomyces beihaiensis]|uniref:Helix-turn-helix transcriptional regulator n=1 Tax=Streptomyces beihaiensis TaxID=2984495 RepID=A0ABT3TMY9_9ACTN|nr:helix-turn-helix transcriptional regulator [Streptomyces beihaiensis]MCX3058409.1 helix-turn-helix transcriptional regulator [Streptomyces beihaiensis]